MLRLRRFLCENLRPSGESDLDLERRLLFLVELPLLGEGELSLWDLGTCLVEGNPAAIFIPEVGGKAWGLLLGEIEDFGWLRDKLLLFEEDALSLSLLFFLLELEDLLS